MIDPKPFVDKAEAESGQTVLTHGEARLRSDDQLGETGLLCAVEDGLVFVEEDLIDPGEVTRIGAADVRVARLDQGFLDATLVVDTGEQVFHFEAMKEEPAAAILDQAGLPQRLTDAGASEPEVTTEGIADRGAAEGAELGAAPVVAGGWGGVPAAPTRPAPRRAFFPDAGGSGATPGAPAAPAAPQRAATRVMVGLLLAMLLSVGFWFTSLNTADEPTGTATEVTIQVLDVGGPIRVVDIFLDGSKICSRSPCTISPQPGTWLLQARKDNRIGKTAIELQPGDAMAVVIQLVEPVVEAPPEREDTPATLRLLTPQTDVHVFIDDKHRGKLPLVIPLLEPGTVELRFERTGSDQTLVRRIELLPGKAHTLNVEVPDEAAGDSGASPATAEPTEAGPALLNCNSIPPSTVFVDGRQVGRTPLAGVVVQPGRHIVMFVHDTLGRKTRSVAVQAGQTATVMARFARPPALSPPSPSPPPATATGAPPGAGAETDYPE